jgi:predicted aspartyl protease
MKQRLSLATLLFILSYFAFSADQKPVVVPIELHEDHVYVSVQVNNSEPLWFLVDSGAAAPVNLLDRNVAERLRLPVEGEKSPIAIGGSARVAFTPAVTLKVGPVNLPAARLGVMALSSQEGSEGHRVDGILGYPFLAALNPEIDYRHHRMLLSESPALGRTSESVPFDLVAKSCRIHAQLTLRPGKPPVPAVLIVDTGYDGSLVLNTPFVEQHKLLESATGSISGGSLGGTTGGGTLQIPALRIGSRMIRKVESRLSPDKEGAFSTSEVDGYVGSSLLKRYSVLFDYKHKRLVLRPVGKGETMRFPLK